MKLATWDRNKELERDDFIVFTEDSPGKQRLIAGVYREEDGKHVVSFFQNQRLTSIIASPLDLVGGVIVGTSDKSFQLRDRIIQQLNATE